MIDSAKRINFLILVLALGMSVTFSARASGFDQPHPLLDQTVKHHVKNGLVDYADLKTHRQNLDGYLALTAAVSESDFKLWSEKQQLAFLINVYNASTLRLVIDHYPVKSIKDIGSILKGPWSQPVVRLFERTMTLDDLEHKMIRVQVAEPRVHFALVCAARGCPPLRSEAYLGERLDAQLDDQAKKFLANSQKNRLDTAGRVAYLSPIFKWYSVDFEKKTGSVLAALKFYWPGNEGVAPGYGDFNIRYTDYDWSLNDSGKQ